VATVVEMISAEAQRQGVDPPLAIEVANAESRLDPNTPDSSAGAIGLFQLEPATAAALGVNPRDLGQNIRGGVTYLRQMLAQFGSVPGALAAYDWGPGHLEEAIAKWGASWVQHLPAETAAYIAKITRNLAKYSASVTPASIANGVTQMISPAPPPSPDGSTPAAPSPAFDWATLLILGGLAVGAYLMAEVYVH